MLKDPILQNKSFEEIFDSVVGMIDEASRRKTTQANPTLEHDLRCCQTSETLRKSYSDEHVTEIPHGDWTRIFGYSRYYYPSLYWPLDGRIYLQKNRWCFSNLLHETLHSRSAFSKKNGPCLNLYFLYEGLTELITGWILQLKLNECFGSWSAMKTCFLRSYAKWAKMWNYFSWKMGIEEVIGIYLNCSLTDPFQALVSLGNAKGYTIKNVFRPYDSAANLESAFRNELSNAFGSDFDEYMHGQILLLEPGVI